MSRNYAVLQLVVESYHNVECFEAINAVLKHEMKPTAIK